MYQVIEQTDEEKMTMYMKLSKKEIISMLIECNKFIDKFTPQVVEEKQYCGGYAPDSRTTGLTCINCGRSQWEH